MALIVVAAGGWYGYQQLSGPSCSGRIALNVAAAPEIAPAVQTSANKWTEDGAAVEGICVAVEVSSTEPVDVAANLASQHGVTLAGVGQASGASVIPDVWLPDSSTWLLRLKTAGATGFAPTNNESVARSPVVLAVPEPVAASALGWPNRKLGWNDLLQQVATNSKLRTGIVEPTRDAAGLSGLLALGSAASAAGADAAKATTAALRALATGRSALRDDLIAKFPRSTDPASIASGLGAASLSEEDVIAYNAKKPPIPLAALYLDPAPLPLDYPYSVMPGVEPTKAMAAQGLFDVLKKTGGFRNALARQGLRAADGTWGEGFAAPQGAPSPAGPAPTSAAPNPGGGTAAGGLDPNAVDRALSTWTAVTQPGRMLAVIDVSGSMKEKVPTAGNATREQVTVAAATKGLSLLDDSWSLGFWTFSTDLVGGQDWREMVPIGPLTTQRDPTLAALRTVVPKTNGNTGLYDTVLAAYKRVQDGWEPGRVNSIVLMTDGQNDNASGINQAKLLAELKKLLDPERPIQVIFVGIGTGVSRAEMEAITKVTGGGAFVAEDPAKIGDIFLKAIALRPTTVR
ncbi:substrate-binding domain-containing protein [Micromonospora sp. NPDC049559]|uniref:substrate-binding domain-containing protein n=1 Tax=Micromonospora sp. NPDC049559 TaxID=3155923 RepID=UPI00343280E8